MTGHRRRFHLQVQDSEEITNIELADAFQQMWAKQRYNEIFTDRYVSGCVIVHKFYSPGIRCGLRFRRLTFTTLTGYRIYIIDQYTYYALEFLEQVEPNSKQTMGMFLEVCPDASVLFHRRSAN